MRSEVCALPRIRFVRSPLGALLRGYVSDPAVLLSGRGPLGGWAYSVVARVRGVRCLAVMNALTDAWCRPRAWGEMCVLCLPHAFAYVRSRYSRGRSVGCFSSRSPRGRLQHC